MLHIAIPPSPPPPRQKSPVLLRSVCIQQLKANPGTIHSPSYECTPEMRISSLSLDINFCLSPGTRYFIWLCVIALAVTYNAMAIPLRASFGEEVTRDGVFFMWLALDIFCDIIYVIDAMAVQPRLCNEGCAGLNTKVGLYICITPFFLLTLNTFTSSLMPRLPDLFLPLFSMQH